MRFGVRSKVFGVSLVLIACVGIPTGMLLETQLRDYLQGRIQAECLRHARTARTLLEALPAPSSVEPADALADALGESTGARVTIIAADGAVQGDSSLSVEQVRAVENHGQRPEVIAAAHQGVGISRRYSATLRAQMLYVATLVRRNGDPAGVIRIAVPLSEVDESVGQLRLLLLVVALVGLLVAVVASGVASQLLTRRVRQLVDRIRAVGRSPDGPRAPTETDELGHLAGSFRRMAIELEETIGKLSGERDRLQTILESMTDAVLALDDRDRIALCNPEAISLLQLDEAPLGQSLTSIVQGSALADLVAQSREGKGAPVGFELDGEPPRQVLARAAPLRMTGGTVLVMQDITEMRRLETIRRDFVANVSHELRTPVSVIRANAETLLAGALDEPANRDFVAAIQRNADRLTALIADLLDLSRIEADSYQLEIGPVDVSAAVEGAVRAVDELRHEHEVTIEVAVEPGLVVLADEGGLGQILLNLVDNAVKYGRDGGQVELRARLVNEAVRIEVIDDGPGIEPRFRGRIFERFYRVDRGRSREAGGTGLGLAIVKHLTDAMGGEVGFEPAPEQGTIFWVRLPRAGSTAATSSD